MLKPIGNRVIIEKKNKNKQLKVVLFLIVLKKNQTKALSLQ